MAEAAGGGAATAAAAAAAAAGSSDSGSASNGSSSGGGGGGAGGGGGSGGEAAVGGGAERDKFAVFLDWLTECNAQSPALELKTYSEEMRGVVCSRDLTANTIIMQIPLRCLITVEMGKDTWVGQAVERSRIELDAPKHIYLMLFMLLDMKKEDSFFKPYYDILPRTLHNMPIFWDEEELTWLRGSYLIPMIEERKLAIQQDYNNIVSICPDFTQVATLEEFKWARMAVCSRNFGLTVNGVRTAAMVPHADMLNHYRPRETKWEFDDSLQAFTITTIAPISSGAQVYDSYGQKCNHRFLLNYGFSVENNVEDDGFCPNEVQLVVSLNTDQDTLLQRKFDMWRGEGITTNKKRFRVAAGDQNSYTHIFAFLRAAVADQTDMDICANYFEIHGYWRTRDLDRPISTRNEVAMMRALRALVAEYVDRFETSLDDDIALLESNDVEPFSNHRNAVIQRVAEKRVLHHYQTFAETALTMLQSPQATLDERLGELYDEVHFSIADYCHQNIPRLRKEEQERASSPHAQVDMSKPTVV